MTELARASNESESGRENALPERRGARRRRMFKSATISFDGLHTALDCVLRDLSDTGARLAVENPVAIPEIFYLVVRDEFVRKSRIVWRSARMIGVAFEMVAAGAAPAPRAGRLRS